MQVQPHLSFEGRGDAAARLQRDLRVRRHRRLQALQRRLDARARVLDRVRLLTGDAVELLRSTKGEFDLIFNDVNKDQYPKVFRLAVPRLRVGGLFITDNVLWSGKVTRPPASNDAETAAIQEFNRLLCTSSKLFTTVIPLRDGLAVSERLR